MTPPGSGHLATSRLIPLAGTPTRLLSIAVSPANAVWVVGTGGAIYTSADGATFARVPSGTRRTLYHVDFESDRQGVILAWGGLRLRTRDGGRSWTTGAPSRLTGTTRILQSISHKGPALAWAVGELRGTVLRTRDAGASWETVLTGRAERLYALSFADERLGFVAGAGGLILSTRDGGDTWLEQRVGQSDWRAVDARPGGVAVVVGDQGSALGTADGGLSWHRIRIASPHDLFAVKLLGHFHGYAAGAAGSLLRFG